MLGSTDGRWGEFSQIGIIFKKKKIESSAYNCNKQYKRRVKQMNVE